MSPVDRYRIKNAPLTLKLAATAGVVFSVLVLALTWYNSLSVLRFHRPSEMCRQLGDDLWALAHYKIGVFAVLLVFQAFAYSALFVLSWVLLQKSTLRRRMKAFLQVCGTTLFIANQIIWFTVPFAPVSQSLAGYSGAISGLFLIGLTFPALWQMWFHKRWRSAKPTRIVVVGGGFAGLYAALGLDKNLGHHRSLEITLIDKKNFFLFPPLLPSASVGTIETRQVTQSYRRIFETTNIRYKKATVTAVDPVAKTVRMHVHLDSEDMGGLPVSDVTLAYDYLILAPGSANQTFGTKGVEQNALFVKDLEDALRIRDRIIDCFERAAVLEDDTVRRELLRFVVVGGGPTGIEIATEIQDLIHQVLLKRYPEIPRQLPEVYIVQSGPAVLPGWPSSVVKTTTRQLKRLGVRLITMNRVTEVQPNAVLLKEGDSIAARTVLWCAGVKPSPLLQSCGLPLDGSGRVAVDRYLSVPGFENVFVLGDSALCLGPDEKPLPPLGQVAFQQGDYLAGHLTRLLRGQTVQPFHYFNFGALVSVGERYAAVDLLGLKVTGFLGWLVWRTLYLAKMIGFSAKIRIMTDWTLDLLIERSIAQLEEHQRRSPSSSRESAAAMSAG